MTSKILQCNINHFISQSRFGCHTTFAEWHATPYFQRDHAHIAIINLWPCKMFKYINQISCLIKGETNGWKFTQLTKRLYNLLQLNSVVINKNMA